MQKIIKKRTKLANYFLNENKRYTKTDILHKEFAVLSFSPHEEYIDTIVTEYDYLCEDLSEFKFEDTDECYIKGIISDIDIQNFQTIIHLQNKDHNISITIRPALFQVYEKYIIVGEPAIAKCNIWNGRLYLSFIVCLNYMDDFMQEQDYMNGSLLEEMKYKNEINGDEDVHYAVVMQCNLVKTKKGKKMLRGMLHDGNEIRSFGCMVNHFNRLVPESLKASDCIMYKHNEKEKFFIHSTRVI